MEAGSPGAGPLDLVVRAARGVGAHGERSMSVGVRNGRIVVVADVDEALEARSTIELADDEVLLPGLVDTHVHINEPGRADWEGFETATRAAAAGGVTTLVDMPLNSIPATVDVPALEEKRAAAAGRVHVDVGFWGGAVPGNASELAALHGAGVFGFKAFMVPSGVDEFGHLSTGDLERALRTVGELSSLLVVHAEDPAGIAAAPEAAGPNYRDFLLSRPPASERTAVETLASLAHGTGARAHVVHVSGAPAVAALADARAAGTDITAETCPHYLFLAADDVADGATPFKCCPPIRERTDQESLWAALEDGVLSCVVSDHSPCTADLKALDSGDFGAAWGGIASLQLGLPVVWTAARSRGVPLATVARWMCSAPADLVGLGQKGRIAPGCDADLCAFAPEEEWVVDPTLLHHRNKVTPYAGRRLTGAVRRTWLRGVEVTGVEPRGHLLRRTGS